VRHGLIESVRFRGSRSRFEHLRRESSDGKLIAAKAQAARFAVLPLHENLQLVGVPDNTDAANAHVALLDLISLIWDLVVPTHDSPPDFEQKVQRRCDPIRPLPYAPRCLIDSSIDA
jgi:hypothetical protein